MIYRIRFHPLVARDLDAIAHRIIDYAGPEAAARKLSEIEAAIATLKTTPHKGSLRDEIALGLRAIPAGRSPTVRSCTSTPKAPAIRRCKSCLRQRTTPSLAGSGPALTEGPEVRHPGGRKARNPHAFPAVGQPRQTSGIVGVPVRRGNCPPDSFLTLLTPQRLPVHPAGLGRPGPIRPLQRQGQHPAGSLHIPALPRRRAQVADVSSRRVISIPDIVASHDGRPWVHRFQRLGIAQSQISGPLF